MAMKAYFIDAVAEEVREVELKDYADIRTLLGCSCYGIACCDAETGDQLYVDDEGLLKPQNHWFMIEDSYEETPVPRGGIWLGPTDLDADGNEVQLPPDRSIDEVRAMVRFVGEADLRAWVAEQRGREILASITGPAADIVIGNMPYAFARFAETAAP